MNQESEDIKKRIQEQSHKLTELGSRLAKNQFSYKIEEKSFKRILAGKNQEFRKI